MAYLDLQQYLKCLESAKKLHWIENPVDPSWEVTAITRQVFDRYGWDDRPALGFRHVGDSPFPLVIGVIGGSPAIYALALSTTVDKIPQVWEKAQRQPIDPTLVQSGFCQEVISRGTEVDIGCLPQVVWTPSHDPGPVYNRAGGDYQRPRNRQTQRRNLSTANENGATPRPICRRGAACGKTYSPVRSE